MLKKISQLLLAVTKWLLASPFDLFVLFQFPFSPSLLDLEVLDETHGDGE